jgi:transcriptional regulator with XRE-family HTH domain
MAELVKLTNELINKSPQLDVDAFWYSDLMGKIVFAYRIRAGLTQYELADLAGIDVKIIHRIEGGSDKDVTTRIFDKVFNILNITSKELGIHFSEKNI